MVLNITYINSGTTYNVVLDDINIKGTLITTSSQQEKLVLDKIQKIIDSACDIYGYQGKNNIASHSSKFDFNDDSIVTGASVLIRSVVNTLHQ